MKAHVIETGNWIFFNWLSIPFHVVVHFHFKWNVIYFLSRFALHTKLKIPFLTPLPFYFYFSFFICLSLFFLHISNDFSALHSIQNCSSRELFKFFNRQTTSLPLSLNHNNKHDLSTWQEKNDNSKTTDTLLISNSRNSQSNFIINRCESSTQYLCLSKNLIYLFWFCFGNFPLWWEKTKERWDDQE